MELVLNKLRIKLDQMAERIISRLKDRSRYKLNKKVYQKDAIKIKNHHGISFFEFALLGLEKYHASLGRYKFPDQYPIFSYHFPSQTKRKVPLSPIAKVKIDLSKDIINYYLGSLKKFCPFGDDPGTYGETVYCDTDLCELLNERINLGRYVAHSKLQKGLFLKDIKSKKELEQRLRNLKREREVIVKARKIAQRYNFPSKVAEEYFCWIIQKTTEVEIDYLIKTNPQISFLSKE